MAFNESCVSHLLKRLLDACVLYPAPVRDLLLQLVVTVYRARPSETQKRLLYIAREECRLQLGCKSLPATFVPT